MSKKIDIKSLFYEQPDREYHVREIARMQNIAPTTASKRLEELRKIGIIEKEEKYNHHIYRAAKSPIFSIERKAYLLVENSKQAKKLISTKKFSAIILTEGGLVGIGTGKVRGVEVVSLKQIQTMKRTNPTYLNALVNGITLAGRWEAFK